MTHKNTNDIGSMGCPKHPSAKRGKCSTCGRYKCCTPRRECSTKECHALFSASNEGPRRKRDALDDSENEVIISTKRNRKVINTTEATEDSVAEESSVVEIARKNRFQPKPQKDKRLQLQGIAQILGLDLVDSINKFPVKGYEASAVSSGDSGASKGRVYQRMRASFRTVVRGLAQLFCDEDPDICYTLLPEMAALPDMNLATRLEKNTLELYLHGSVPVSIVAGSLLASSFQRDELDAWTRHAVEHSEKSVQPRRRIFGVAKFADRRRTFQTLCKGDEIPIRQYTCRLKAGVLSNAIQYIQEKLPLKAGFIRNVRIDGHTFQKMPAYELGGLSITRLFEDYKASMGQLQQPSLGEANFFSIAKLLTRKGENLTALSTYYVKLRDAPKKHNKIRPLRSTLVESTSCLSFVSTTIALMLV